MKMFERRGNRMPELNTASLPDMIFTVLFFFMIVTTMREIELKVNYTTPQTNDVEKVGKRSTISHIYIGNTDEGIRIQLGDKIGKIDDIPNFIAEERAHIPADEVDEMRVSISADKDVPMGVISDVKEALRYVNALNIIYSVEKDKEK